MKGRLRRGGACIFKKTNKIIVLELFKKTMRPHLITLNEIPTYADSTSEETG